MRKGASCRVSWPVVLGTAVVTTAILLGGYALLLMKGYLLPSWVTWEDVGEEADLVGDDALERYVVEDRRLVVLDAEGKVLCRSPRELVGGWLVQRVVVDDVDGDGTSELVLLAWRWGNYGDSHPFWESDRDTDLTQHVFIVRVDTDPTGEDIVLRRVWMSSGLSFEASDMELDREGRLRFTTPDGDSVTYEWQGWGLYGVS